MAYETRTRVAGLIAKGVKALGTLSSAIRVLVGPCFGKLCRDGGVAFVRDGLEGR